MAVNPVRKESIFFAKEKKQQRMSTMVVFLSDKCFYPQKKENLLFVIYFQTPFGGFQLLLFGEKKQQQTTEH